MNTHVCKTTDITSYFYLLLYIQLHICTNYINVIRYTQYIHVSGYRHILTSTCVYVYVFFTHMNYTYI